MRVALIGSVSSSEACLAALIEAGVEVVGVLGLAPLENRSLTRADVECYDVSLDSPASPNVSPISDYRDLEPIARRAGISFRSFRKVTEPGVAAFLREHSPDLLWVIGLSQLVPRSVIDLASAGGIGFHPTMLPRGRGRAPVAWTILLGEPAAVSLFHLTEEPDAGDLIAQREVPVLPDDYSDDLIARTNEGLKEVIRDLGPALLKGVLPRAPQDSSKTTYYPKRTPKDGLMDWSQSTDALYRLVRAAGRPYPGAFTHLNGAKLTVWRARPERPEALTEKERSAAVGEVLRATPGQALVRTGDGALWISEFAVGSVKCGVRFGAAEFA